MLLLYFVCNLKLSPGKPLAVRFFTSYVTPAGYSGVFPSTLILAVVTNNVSKFWPPNVIAVTYKKYQTSNTYII